MANANQVVFSFLARTFVPNLYYIDLEFQFMATTTVSMAAKSSDLEDRISGANLQMEGHVDMPSKSTKDPGETIALR